MPDNDDINDDGADLVPRSHIRGLEEKARRADELAAEVERLQKESVFSSALTGIDHPGLSYFKNAYDGDLTPEAIRQAAIEAGFGHSEPETDTRQTQPAATPTAPDLAAHQRMAAAAVGSAPPPPFDLAEEISKAKNSDEVMALIEAHGEKHGLISSRLAQ